MGFYITKMIITTLLIVAISEIAKRSSVVGAILASLPLVSVLAMIWMYVDTQETTKIVEFSQRIIWLVLPSWSLFISFPLFIKKGFSFYPSLGMAIGITVALYFLMLFIFDKMGITL
jgi:hypothetical protein